MDDFVSLKWEILVANRKSVLSFQQNVTRDGTVRFIVPSHDNVNPFCKPEFKQLRLWRIELAAGDLTVLRERPRKNGKANIHGNEPFSEIGVSRAR